MENKETLSSAWKEANNLYEAAKEVARVVRNRMEESWRSHQDSLRLLRRVEDTEKEAASILENAWRDLKESNIKTLKDSI
ncbi:MAG TPA: hypothetical protein ENI23_10395 [bacterium]|nr:hypothetical protein [bacterium]